MRMLANGYTGHDHGTGAVLHKQNRFELSLNTKFLASLDSWVSIVLVVS